MDEGEKMAVAERLIRLCEPRLKNAFITETPEFTLNLTAAVYMIRGVPIRCKYKPTCYAVKTFSLITICMLLVVVDLGGIYMNKGDLVNLVIRVLHQVCGGEFKNSNGTLHEDWPRMIAPRYLFVPPSELNYDTSKNPGFVKRFKEGLECDAGWMAFLEASQDAIDKRASKTPKEACSGL
jgi:hypothetical protein